MVAVVGVGEVAGVGDRPRAADLVGPVGRIQGGQLVRDVARDHVVGVDRRAVDRRDVHPAPEVVVADRAAGGELRVVAAHAADRDLVLLGELRQHRDDARVDPAGLDVGDAVAVEHDVLVVQQRERRGVRCAARALGAELLWVHRRPRGLRRVAHGGRGGRGRVGRDARRGGVGRDARQGGAGRAPCGATSSGGASS